MTAIFYPDLTATSDGGEFTLEARSPHNGTIRHRDGREPSVDEFAFKYRQHQGEFRYRLMDGERRVAWERWQTRGEDSPGELVVADDGWAVIRTHGFSPEVIAVAPDGRDVARVRVVWADGEHPEPAPDRRPPVYYWPLDHLACTTAGHYWSGHSWRAFFQHGGASFFHWRASWGQRLVLDLGGAVAFTDEREVPFELAASVVEAEREGVVNLLEGLSRRMDEVRALLSRRSGDEEQKPDPLLLQVRQASNALHLAGVHRLQECVPFLREWESIDLPSLSMGSTAMTGRWQLQTQLFRPIVHHALKLLGEEPRGFPTYNFCTYSDDRTADRFRMPERLADRRERAAQVSKEMSAEEVLHLLGSPDFIRRHSRQVGKLYEWPEDWEYDLRDGTTWTTLRLTWEERRREVRMTAVEWVAPYWLDGDDREAEYLRF
jgi:hypothetical protein